LRACDARLGVKKLRRPWLTSVLELARLAAPNTTQLADGLACRIAEHDALQTMARHVDHVVQMSALEVAQAMRALYQDTHNVAEGAGAASFAAATQERAGLRGLCVGTTLCGGNVDAAVLARVLQA